MHFLCLIVINCSPLVTSTFHPHRFNSWSHSSTPVPLWWSTVTSRAGLSHWCFGTWSSWSSSFPTSTYMPTSSTATSTTPTTTLTRNGLASTENSPMVLWAAQETPVKATSTPTWTTLCGRRCMPVACVTAPKCWMVMPTRSASRCGSFKILIHPDGGTISRLITLSAIPLLFETYPWWFFIFCYYH